MSLKDIFGMIFISAGATLGTIGYRLLGLQWYFGACVLIAIGVHFIWTSARDRKIRDAMNEVSGDWGDRHYISESSSTDDYSDGHHHGEVGHDSDIS